MWKMTAWTVWIVLVISPITAQALSPPQQIILKDAPNDAGNRVMISWQPVEGAAGYNILRRESPTGKFEPILDKPLPPGKTSYTDETVRPNELYYYVLVALDEKGGEARSEVVGPVKPTGEWFHTGRIWVLVGLAVLSAVILTSLYTAHPDMRIRKIPGLEAVEEAIGRATEMGRPVLYILGLAGAGSLTTIASMNILAQVARRCAEYETRLLVPCFDPVVMNIVREIVRNSYSQVGRPDRYVESDIFFLSDMQFAYAAAVDGIMARERPGAVFLQGYFYAESLILAETANTVGAIQIAGTTSDAQLPFFIAACDYTLIGEEMFAASAYLSREPRLLGTVRGQDIGKLILMLMLILGLISEMLGFHWATEFFNIAKTR
ncbi:TPA: hypothetical protein EYP37_04285 [Candidatus Poribacteria bacterium]|nr:hypothetical protein [Candidatus Poribacteria bacterium]